MNKILMLTVLALLVVSTVQAVSVSAQTIVAGKIYNADYSQPVSGASVDVTCNGNKLSTTSLSDDGSYAVEYTSTDCNATSSLSVHAIKSGIGENTVSGIVHDFNLGAVNVGLGVVNVPLIPEFGLLAGTLTLVSAVGIFFLVRKN